MTTELTQRDYEAAEVDAIEAYLAWQQSERHAFEARRTRREAEVFDG